MKDELREQQRQAWNKFSPGWKKWDSFVIEWLKPIGQELIEESALEDGFCVLDMATGTGEPGLTAALKIGSGKVIGVDLAEEMVKIAGQNAEIKGVKNYEALTADASALSFEDNYFDAVICRHGVMFFPDMPDGLKEMARVLKPGRKLALSAWALPSKNPWVTTIKEVLHKMLDLPSPPADAPGLFRCAQPGTLKKLLEESGFYDVEESEVAGKINFISAEQYWEFITDVVAPIASALSKVDEEAYQKAKQAVINEVENKYGKGDVSFDWSSWVASGIKKTN
ncbi:MAG TPA: methyltransferase domain-containing protein [Candidatus Nanoarchaeia archaeon]|nr:methyltransferase domain-containing protein [Candidatus Nanoarchaeia archaeon]